MTHQDPHQDYEKQLDDLIDRLRGPAESDWTLVRALVHKAVHVAADRRAGEFCAVATLLAEMIQHAHDLMHPGKKPTAHSALTH